jgi:hypothetical protein
MGFGSVRETYVYLQLLCFGLCWIKTASPRSVCHASLCTIFARNLDGSCALHFVLVEWGLWKQWQEQGNPRFSRTRLLEPQARHNCGKWWTIYLNLFDSAEQDCLNLKLDTIVASDGQFIWRVRLLLKRTCLGTSNNQAWSTVTSLQIQPLYIAYIVLLYVVLTTAGQTDLGGLLIVTQFQSRMFMFWVRYQSKMLCSFQVGFRVSCLCPF